VQEGSRRAIIAALLANLGIAIAKFVAWSVTGSSAMLAEGVHSLADTGNQVLLILGGSRAKRDPTPEHPFGYGRERYFWAFVVSVVLFILGSLFAIYEGVEKLRHPHALESPQWAIGVLIVALVLEGLSLRTAVREALPLKGENSWWSFVRHAKSPELPVVLLEDLAAQLGLLFALSGVGLATVLDEPRFDAIGTLAIGGLLFAVAVVLASEMKSLLIGEGASPEVRRQIVAAIESTPRVRRLIHMRTLHLGPEELLVGAKLELESELAFAEVALTIDTVEAGVRARVPSARIIFLEPDVYREQGGNGGG
jgi:cation diffusion facilitator family transporter